MPAQPLSLTFIPAGASPGRRCRTRDCPAPGSAFAQPVSPSETVLFSSPPASRTEAEQDAAVCRRLQRGFWRLSGIKTPKSPAEIYAPFSVGSAQAFGEGQGKSQKRGNEVAEAFCFFLPKLNYAPSSRLEFRGSAAGATSTLDSPHFNRDVRNWGEGTPSAGLR